MIARKGFILFVAISILASFGLLNCDSMSRWRIAPAKGLKTAYENLNRMLFVSDSIGFLFGSHASKEALLKKQLRTQQQAIIYKTKDSGLTWYPTLNAGHGSFIDAVILNDTIYALKREYFGEQVDQIKSAGIFRSVNLGESWETVSHAPTNSMSLCLCDSKRIFIISNAGKNEVGRELYQTNNGGRHWSISNDYKAIGNPTCLRGGKTLMLLGVTRIDKLSFDLLIEKDLHSGDEKVEPIPFEAYVLVSEESEKLWLLGKDGAGVALYYKSKTTGFDQVSVFKSDKRITPYHLNVFDNIITVIVRESEDKKESTYAFPVGNKYRIYRSEDLGKSWTEEAIPVNYLVEPFAFYGKERIWMNAGGGRLQWRE